MILLNTPSRRAYGAGSVGAALLLCHTLPAHAGRPMTVEDAAIVAPGQCQLETYAQQAGAAREFWATPACNVGDTWELAAGGASAETAGHSTRYGRLQAKTVFKPLEAGSWGVGLVLGNQFRSGRGVDGDLSANVPLSFALRDDRVLLHVNAGVVRTQATRSTDASWGVGAEFILGQSNSLTAEVYGQQRANARYQFGFAHALIPDQVQIDCTWGKRLARGASEPMVTLGLVLLTR